MSLSHFLPSSFLSPWIFWRVSTDSSYNLSKAKISFASWFCVCVCVFVVSAIHRMQFLGVSLFENSNFDSGISSMGYQVSARSGGGGQELLNASPSNQKRICMYLGHSRAPRVKPPRMNSDESGRPRHRSRPNGLDDRIGPSTTDRPIYNIYLHTLHNSEQLLQLPFSCINRFLFQKWDSVTVPKVFQAIPAGFRLLMAGICRKRDPNR